MTTPISDNFETRIINELMLAQRSIKIAVAWFNSKNILDILCWKLRGGVNVEIILHYDDVNSGSESSLDFSEYKQLGGILVWAKAEKSTMHVKFCIIDDRVLLHGSCNWTYRAFMKNDEVLNVTTEEPEMIRSYNSTFFRLKEKYNKAVEPLNQTDSFAQNEQKKVFNAETQSVLSIDERKHLFLQALQPFETKYDKDYLHSFIEYWLTENMGKLRIEVDDNDCQINLLEITPDFLRIKLENWKSNYEIILKDRQTSLIIKEINCKIEILKRDYERKNVELRCNTIIYTNYTLGVYNNRLFGKILYDRGHYMKDYSVFDTFLQIGSRNPLCYPIEEIAERECVAFPIFCLLYEANQAFKRNKEFNQSVLSLIGPENTYNSFCKKYGINCNQFLKNDKSIKELIDSLEYPITLKYNGGAIEISMKKTLDKEFLLKLNEVWGLQLLTAQYDISTAFIVPYNVLYTMDGMQFDLRDDSFENGTMKSIKLPLGYKDGQFYISEIEKKEKEDMRLWNLWGYIF